VQPATCKQECETGKLRGPNNTYLCGAVGCSRFISGGLAPVRETLCDFHAQMWIDRGFTVRPEPAECRSTHSLDSLHECSKGQPKTKQLCLL
jgi:hypothetical protein